jgi:hypothetical protein
LDILLIIIIILLDILLIIIIILLDIFKKANLNFIKFKSSNLSICKSHLQYSFILFLV